MRRNDFIGFPNIKKNQKNYYDVKDDSYIIKNNNYYQNNQRNKKIMMMLMKIHIYK
jgi:hypothetical protein